MIRNKFKDVVFGFEHIGINAEQAKTLLPSPINNKGFKDKAFSEFQKETQVVKVFDTVGNNQVAEVTPVQIGSKNGSNTIPTLNQREAGSDIT